jgi:hypothetical protein
MGVTSAVVLVDWDNVVPGRVRTEIDAEGAVDGALELVVGPVLASCPDVIDLQVRLYGSWRWQRGGDTAFGSLISSAAQRSNRRVGGTYVTTSSVASLAVEAEYEAGPRLTPFLSQRRCRCAHRERIYEQKLADTMIVGDAIYYAQFLDFAVVVASDDIDVSPGLMMASSIRGAVPGTSTDDVIWLRPRADEVTVRRRFQGFFRVI